MNLIPTDSSHWQRFEASPFVAQDILGSAPHSWVEDEIFHCEANGFLRYEIGRNAAVLSLVKPLERHPDLLAEVRAI